MDQHFLNPFQTQNDNYTKSWPAITELCPVMCHGPLRFCNDLHVLKVDPYHVEQPLKQFWSCLNDWNLFSIVAQWLLKNVIYDLWKSASPEVFYSPLFAVVHYFFDRVYVRPRCLCTIFGPLFLLVLVFVCQLLFYILSEFVLRTHRDDQFFECIGKRHSNATIPQYIHQIFFFITDKELPKQYQENQTSWITQNPEYDYTLWNATMIEDLIRDKYPKLRNCTIVMGTGLDALMWPGILFYIKSVYLCGYWPGVYQTSPTFNGQSSKQRNPYVWIAAIWCGHWLSCDWSKSPVLCIRDSRTKILKPMVCFPSCPSNVIYWTWILLWSIP